MKWVVEQDEQGTFTTRYEVEAPTREVAIQFVVDGKAESSDTEFFGDGVVSYKDTHEVKE